MTEERYRAFDITTKIIGGLGATLLLLIGYWQFKALYAKEFGLKFYSEKIEYIVNMNTIMGQISTDYIDEITLEQAIDDFKQAYYIKNVFIEDTNLLESINSFNNCVNTFRARIEQRKNDSTKVRLYTIDVMNKSKDLAKFFGEKSNEVLKNHIAQ